jgi:hypothetical protein
VQLPRGATHKEALVSTRSVSRHVDARGCKPGEASPLSVREIVTYFRHARMLAETLCDATNGRS